MTKEHEDRIDSTRPALIVLYGATKRKFRPLEGDLVVLGRAPGCDIGLVSPEVAPVHCVIVRLADGWRIRDCSGRATRVNGKAVQDEPLRNGDTIQVGTFSFEAQLPPSHAPARARDAERGGGALGRTPGADTTGIAIPELQRLQGSRRRLAELALGLRRRLRERAAEGEDLAHRKADLEQVERRLRKAHEEQMKRDAALAERHAELVRRAGELDLYAAHLRRKAAEPGPQGEELEKLQAELVREREEVQQARQELMQERIELERLKERLTQQTPAPASTHETLESARKLLRDLAERRKSAPGVVSTGRKSRTRQPRPPEARS